MAFTVPYLLRSQEEESLKAALELSKVDCGDGEEEQEEEEVGGATGGGDLLLDFDTAGM